MCKQLRDATAVYHILYSYSVHQMSWTEEVQGFPWTSCMLGFSQRRKAERITERRGWKQPLAQEKFIQYCTWIAVRWWNTAQRVMLTCIHKMCHHSCPGTPRLGEGPLFLLLLTKWEDISDFHKRWQPMKIILSPDCCVVWICSSVCPWSPALTQRMSVQAAKDCNMSNKWCSDTFSCDILKYKS